MMQKQSLAFFINLANRGANGILADDMGLGKTCQSIAIIIATRHLTRIQQQKARGKVARTKIPR